MCKGRCCARKRIPSGQANCQVLWLKACFHLLPGTCHLLQPFFSVVVVVVVVAVTVVAVIVVFWSFLLVVFIGRFAVLFFFCKAVSTGEALCKGY